MTHQHLEFSQFEHPISVLIELGEDSEELLFLEVFLALPHLETNLNKATLAYCGLGREVSDSLTIGEIIDFFLKLLQRYSVAIIRI